MKCTTEKRLPHILLAAALCAVAGCAPVAPRERVVGKLDADGELYLVSDSTEFIREGAVWYDEIERKVAESKSPRRDAVQSHLTALKMLGRFAGASGIEVVGLSSRREPDGSHLTRSAAAGQIGTPWPWNVGGVPGDRLRDLSALPAETIAAASFTFDAGAAAAELRRSGAETLLEYKPPLLLGFSLGEILSRVSGAWQTALLPPPSADGKADWSRSGFYLAFPDREGAIYRRLSAVLPSAGNGMVRLPDGKASLIIGGGDDRIRIYSSPECRSAITAPRRTLGDTEKFGAAAKKLASSVSGAFYLSDDGIAVGVWKFQPGLAELSAYSTRTAPAHALRRLLLNPFSLVVDRALARPQPRPVTAKKTPVPERRTALPMTGVLQKRRAALAGAMADMTEQHKKSGRFPEELPEKYAGLVWFGAPPDGGSGKLPLIVEAPAPGRPGIGVLFADGTIEFFDFPAASLKHLCSFLHTRYHYDEKDFVRLIRRASELDAKKKGNRP